MNVFDWISAASAAVLVLGGIFALFKVVPEIRKVKADTSKVEIDAATAEQAADDEHWKGIIAAQTASLLTPLREEVERLSRKVDALEGEVKQATRRYWNAIRALRAVHAWARTLGLTPPPLPQELEEDVAL